MRWQGVKATGDESGDTYILNRRETNDFTLSFDDEFPLLAPSTKWSYSYNAKYIRQGDGVVLNGSVEHEITFGYDADTGTVVLANEEFTYRLNCP